MKRVTLFFILRPSPSPYKEQHVHNAAVHSPPPLYTRGTLPQSLKVSSSGITFFIFYSLGHLCSVEELFTIINSS